MNRELFEKIHVQATDHPETFDRNSWESSCGTTRCLAGWAIHFTHPELDLETAVRKILQGRGEPVPPASGGDYVVAGAEVLGLTLARARELFLHTREGELLDIIAQYAAGELNE